MLVELFRNFYLNSRAIKFTIVWLFVLSTPIEKIFLLFLMVQFFFMKQCRMSRIYKSKSKQFFSPIFDIIIKTKVCYYKNIDKTQES